MILPVERLGAPRVAVVRQAAEYSPALLKDSLDRAMRLLGVDWEDLAMPGQHVVIKPNLIRQGRLSRDDEWEQIVTHGQVISVITWAVARALRGRGKISIADAPQTDSDFDIIRSRLGLDSLLLEVQAAFPHLTLSLTDLRREIWTTRDGVVVERMSCVPAPEGYVCIDLGSNSSLGGKAGPFYGADYDADFTQHHHTGGRHEYLLSRLAMNADLFINVPKLKTHKKVGITVSLKNLVGINGDKNYLPHFATGTPRAGGDELPDGGWRSHVQSFGIRAFKRAMSHAPSIGSRLGPAAKRLGVRLFGSTNEVIRSGNWHGNDTAWRMVHDLNKILLHYSGDGALRRQPLRYLSIVDGIVAGDGNGPMDADPVPCGLLLAGTNPVAVDWVAALLMGFDPSRIPLIREAFLPSTLPLTSFSPDAIEIVPGLGLPFRFRPHFGWVGQVEAA